MRERRGDALTTSIKAVEEIFNQESALKTKVVVSKRGLTEKI
jgi:hypothetical protein